MSLVKARSERKMPLVGKNRGIKVLRALVSASSKSKILEFARFLAQKKIEIFSTSGTVSYLRGKGVPAKDISKIVGSQILSGRVKTLSRKIFAGVLANRFDPSHKEEIKNLKIPIFDLVCVIPYRLGGLPESVDIGGISLLRAAAKNHRSVVPVFDPLDFDRIRKELSATGFISFKTARALAAKTFFFTSGYDLAIGEKMFKSVRNNALADFFENLRYGENPQDSAFLLSRRESFSKISGKQISLNNIVDMDAAFSLVAEFRKPAVVVIKHRNPCGVACAGSISRALASAFEADSESAFGGVFAFNRKVDDKSAAFLKSKFVDCVIAPDFEKRAFDVLSKKKTTLVVAKSREKSLFLKDTSFGTIIEKKSLEPFSLKVVTKTRPTQKQIRDLLFAWKVVKHTTSNAIVVARDEKTLAICGGCQSRVRAVKNCLGYCGRRSESVLASDGFFPFPDSVAFASKMGVKAIIQPGGSIRDEKVIAEANRRKISMVFTGQRCFLH